MAPTGIENAVSTENTGAGASLAVEPRSDEPAKYPDAGRVADSIGPIATAEGELAHALAAAAAAGRWDVVSQLARELEARRLGASGVADLRDRLGRR